MYINTVLTEYSIDPGCWFTVETLGYKTEIEENINSGSIIIAPENWRPTPIQN